MRVALVLGGAEDGGLEKHTIELAHSLQDRGVDIAVIAHGKFKSDFKDIKFFELDLSKSRNNPFILYRLYEILKRESFDIIHTQANKATDMVIKLKPFLNSKIVSTLHSYKKNTKSFEKADFVITVSDKIGENIKNKNRVTIYNGIRPDNISDINLYDRYSIQKNGFIICSIGRFVQVKRFDLLLKSIKNCNVHLLLVGDGDEKGNLVQLSKKLNVENRVTFTGYLNQKETKEIIKSSKLFVMTSQKEGFPYTFIESMLCETPFISTDVSDVKKFIPSKFITKLDAKDIADKIEEFYGNYKENLALYKSLFEIAKAKFSIKNMTNKTIDIYKKVLDDL